MLTTYIIVVGGAALALASYGYHLSQKKKKK